MCETLFTIAYWLDSQRVAAYVGIGVAQFLGWYMGSAASRKMRERIKTMVVEGKLTPEEANEITSGVKTTRVSTSLTFQGVQDDRHERNAPE